jgi:hypothetical protein
MRSVLTHVLSCTFSLFMLESCSSLSDAPDQRHDPQLLKIQYQYGFRDELNTFAGTYQKDLVLDGTVKVPFWLSAEEQDTILGKAMAVEFFSFPDTILAEAGVCLDPNPSPDVLRLEYGETEKTVLWSYPLDPASGYTGGLLELTSLIREVIESKAEYKRLPAARGGYL